jgi:hypothetical protein
MPSWPLSGPRISHVVCELSRGRARPPLGRGPFIIGDRLPAPPGPCLQVPRPAHGRMMIMTCSTDVRRHARDERFLIVNSGRIWVRFDTREPNYESSNRITHCLRRPARCEHRRGLLKTACVRRHTAHRQDCLELRRDLTAFLYRRMRDYCIDMIPSRWATQGANVGGAGGL